MSTNVATLRSGAQIASIIPTSFEDCQRIARMAVAAGLAPKARGDGDDNVDEQIARATMSIMQGLECGIPPMQAVQGIAIINGRALIYGDLLTALLWKNGFKVKKWVTGEGDNRVGHARITRPDGEVIEKSFSVEQAKRARLWDPRETLRKKGRNDKWYDAPNDSPWFRFDERMLEWRAFGFCVKDGASDATHGMLVYEEHSPEANSIVDVTPEKKIAKSAAPDLPPDLPEDDPTIEDAVELVIDNTSLVPGNDEDTIANPDELLAHIEEDIALAGPDAAAVAEVAEQYADLIERLPATARSRANKMLEAAGP